MGALEEIAVVVPCYDEAGRIDRSELVRLARTDGTRILFVDDGSTDATAAILEQICAASDGRASLLCLGRNRGKAEAVRHGLLAASGEDVDLVGYLDADLSTPVDEFTRLVGEARKGRAAVVMGARVALSGRRIDRRPWRHYGGRIFATMASLVLGARIYDTQCGAKLFRNTAGLRAALAEPFISRWIFDVELIGRLISEGNLDPGEIVEVPLLRWRDVEGSKLGLLDAALAAVELGRIAADLRRRRS